MPKNTQANKASNKSKEGEQTSSGSGSGASLFNVEPSLIKNFLQNFNTFSEQWNGGLATHTHRLDELMESLTKYHNIKCDCAFVPWPELEKLGYRRDQKDAIQIVLSNLKQIEDIRLSRKKSDDLNVGLMDQREKLITQRDELTTQRDAKIEECVVTKELLGKCVDSIDFDSSSSSVLSVNSNDSSQCLWYGDDGFRSAVITGGSHKRHFALSNIDEHCYVLGGTDCGKNEVSDQCHEFFFDSTAVSYPLRKVKEMLAPREKHCAASLNGKIFVFGGSEEQNGQPLNLIDCYDGIVDTWKREGFPLLQKRASAACVDFGRTIYIVGGTDVDSTGKRNCIETIERFDPRCGRCDEAGSLATGRDTPAITVVNGAIYIVGGGTFSGSRFKASDGIEIFEPRMGTSEVQDHLLLGRRAPGLALVKSNKQMLIYGGWNNTILDSIESGGGPAIIGEGGNIPFAASFYNLYF